ncbi:MAG: SdrD B-like domain-containing protein [Bacteroidota bacterium]
MPLQLLIRTYKSVCLLLLCACLSSFSKKKADRPLDSSSPFTITGTVWQDRNNNGLNEPERQEFPIENVLVELIDLTNTVIDSDNTDASGTFSLTAPTGDYRVRINSSNFGTSSSSALRNRDISTRNRGFKSSTYQMMPDPTGANTPDPDADMTDNDDNGIDELNPNANGVVSQVFTLSADRDDIDFGFFPMSTFNVIPDCKLPGQTIDTLIFSTANELGYPLDVNGVVATNGGTIIQGRTGSLITMPFPVPGFALSPQRPDYAPTFQGYRPWRPNYFTSVESYYIEVNSGGVAELDFGTYFNPYGNSGNGRTEDPNRRSPNTTQICSNHIYFDSISFVDAANQVIDPMDIDVPSGFTVTIDRDFNGGGGPLVTCTWDNTAKTFTCDIDATTNPNSYIPNANNAQDGMWVPLRSGYTVTFNGLPANYTVTAGGGSQTFEPVLIRPDGSNEGDDYGIHGYYREFGTVNGDPNFGQFEASGKYMLHPFQIMVAPGPCESVLLGTLTCEDDAINTSTLSDYTRTCTSGNPKVAAFWTGGAFRDIIPQTATCSFNDQERWKTVGTGTFEEYANGTALIKMTLEQTCDAAKQMELVITLSGRTFSTPTSPSGSPAFGASTNCVSSGSTPTTDWYYYTEASGLLTGIMDLEGLQIELVQKGPALQVGTGANQFNQNGFGLSKWFDPEILSQPNSGPNVRSTNLYDINADVDQSILSEEPITSCFDICNGGDVTITATPQTGTAPYTYLGAQEK